MTPALLALAQSAAEELPPGTGGFGAQLARTALALLAVCAGAWAILRYAARRGMLGASSKGQHMTVLERVALDPRRSLFLVRVGRKALVLGASEGDGLRALAELPLDALALEEDRPARSFSDALEDRKREAERGPDGQPREAPSKLIESPSVGPDGDR